MQEIMTMCELIKNNNNKLLLPVQLFGLNVEALIDTGADSNFISETLYQQLIKRCPTVVQLESSKEKSLVKVANNNTEVVITTVLLPMYVAEDMLTIEVKVLRNLSQNMILGLEFIKQHRLIVDSDEQTLEIKKKSSHYLSTIDEYQLQPYSETDIIVKVPCPTGGTHLIEYTDELLTTFGVAIARGVVELKDTQINLRIANLTAKTEPIYCVFSWNPCR